MHKSKGLTLNKTDTILTPSAAKSVKEVNPKCTGAANPKCMGATGKNPPLSARQRNTLAGGVSLTWSGLNPNWHAGANPKCMGAAGKEISPCQRQRDALKGGFL